MLSTGWPRWPFCFIVLFDIIELMNEVFIIVSLAVIGAALGSFAGAQVWRLRAHQLVEDKEAGEEVDAKELKRLRPLTKQSFLKDRSIDLDTGKPLPWYDLIPIVSWVLLRGKSRFSGKPIGVFELLMELGVAAFFVASYLLWPFDLTHATEIIKFVVWLVAGVVLAIQFATDLKWQILWTLLSYLVIALGLVYASLTVIGFDNALLAIYSVIGSVAILGGLYFFLYWISKERWVGLGDAILGIGLGLLLADWALALVALFLANLIGTIIVLIGFAARRMKRHQHVPFGPMLILGAVIAQLAGSDIIQWYFSVFLP